MEECLDGVYEIIYFYNDGRIHVSTRKCILEARSGHLIMHEHLFIFRKPKPGENLSRIKFSSGLL